jgi:hypothetical protein
MASVGIVIIKSECLLCSKTNDFGAHVAQEGSKSFGLRSVLRSDRRFHGPELELLNVQLQVVRKAEGKAGGGGFLGGYGLAEKIQISQTTDNGEEG